MDPKKKPLSGRFSPIVPLSEYPLFQVYRQLDQWGAFRRSPGQPSLPRKHRGRKPKRFAGFAQ